MTYRTLINNPTNNNGAPTQNAPIRTYHISPPGLVNAHVECAPPRWAVANDKAIKAYPDILWYLYTFLAFAGPPRSFPPKWTDADPRRDCRTWSFS